MNRTVTYDPTQWQLVPKRTIVRMAEEGWQSAVDRAVLNIDNWDVSIMYEAMLAAAPEYPAEQQEPIGEVMESSVHPDAFGIYKHTFYSEERIPVGAELFVCPVGVVSEPLTDEEILSIENGHSGHSVIEFARAIERRVREGKL